MPKVLEILLGLYKENVGQMSAGTRSLGSKGHFDHCLWVIHMGLAGSGQSILLWGGSFGSSQEMLCPQPLLSDLRDKLERRP